MPFGLRGKDDRFAALKGLSQLHMMGYDINWAHLTKDCARYVRLPLYPWQRNAYKLEAIKHTDRCMGSVDKSFTGQQGEVNCLMHEFLEDYKLDGKARFCSSASVEYLAELASDVVALEGIEIYSNPEMMCLNENVILDYESLWIKEKTIADEITLFERDTRKRVAFAMKVSNPTDQKSVNINELKTRCHNFLDIDQIYEAFSSKGLYYGKAFRVLKQVQKNEKDAIAILKPEINRHERAKTVTLDGCFQLAMAAFSPNCPATVRRIGFLHMFVDRMPLGQNMLALASLVNCTSNGFTADFYLSTENGESLLSMTNVFFEIVDKRSKNEPFLFAKTYNTIETLSKPVVFIDDKSKDIKQLSKSIPSKLVATHMVRTTDIDVFEGSVVVMVWKPITQDIEFHKRQHSLNGLLEGLSDTINQFQIQSDKCDFNTLIVTVLSGNDTLDTLVRCYLRGVSSNLNLTHLELQQLDLDTISQAISLKMTPGELVFHDSKFKQSELTPLSFEYPKPTADWDMHLPSESVGRCDFQFENLYSEMDELEFCKTREDMRACFNLGVDDEASKYGTLHSAKKRRVHSNHLNYESDQRL